MACYIRSERSLQLKHFRYPVESLVIHPQRTPVLLMPFFTGCADDRQQIDGVCTECRIFPQNRFGTAFYDDRKLLTRFLTEVNECFPSHVRFAEVHQVDKWDATQIEAQQEEVAGKIEFTVLTQIGLQQTGDDGRRNSPFGGRLVADENILELLPRIE